MEITLDKEISRSFPLRNSSFAIAVVLNIEFNLVSNIAFALIELSLLIKILTCPCDLNLAFALIDLSLLVKVLK